MADWKVKLDAFLQLNEVQILTHAGKISAEMAKEIALSEYSKFEELRKQESVMHGQEDLQEALRNLLDYRESSKSSEE
ncbi:MAG: RhuM family protein [Rhabdochlamydiaceae bacterium]